ncbi:uncharacterized protein BBOV_IV000140 [Babesia bovis T2Bo]|uniref:Uncharacterized protein n=1 Tax=Babesia bovis TaxID=5865 RepID=A7AUY8_BABBO|nr:uncharacterized protein BBOV_IV000140 [Babesia bovis T2Bo]EDO05614.1 hypothetical protein BBOV_IV000140 [Babesia bovis T2Bo]|eukprot:XP_001609182.1 hypothetical protein [Babesia bovis T2Bo]
MTPPLRFIEEANKNIGKTYRNDNPMVSDNADDDSLSASTSNKPDNCGTQLESAEDKNVSGLLPSRSKGNMDDVAEGCSNDKINENDAASDASSVPSCVDHGIIAPQIKSKDDEGSITENIQVKPVITNLMMTSVVSVDNIFTTDSSTDVKPNSETTVPEDFMIAVTADVKSPDDDVTHSLENNCVDDSPDSTSKSPESPDDKIPEVIVRHTEDQSTMDLQEKGSPLDNDSSDHAQDTKMKIDETPLTDALNISSPLTSMTTEPLAVKSTDDGCKTVVEMTDNIAVDIKTIDEPIISPPEVLKSIDIPDETGLLSTVVSRKAGDQHSELLSVDSVSISRGEDEPITDPVVSSSKIPSDIDELGSVHQSTDHVETMATTGNDDKKPSNDTTVVSPLDSDDHRESINDVVSPMSSLSNTNAMISPVSSTDEEIIHSDVNHISDVDTDVNETVGTLPNDAVMDEDKDVLRTDAPISDAETLVMSHTVSMDATMENSIPLDAPEHIEDRMQEASIPREENPVEENAITEITVLNNDSKLFSESASTLDTVVSSEQNLSPTIALSSSTTSTDKGDNNELEYTLDSAKTVSLEESNHSFGKANTVATDSIVNRPEIIPRSSFSVALDDDDSSNKLHSNILNGENTEETMNIRKLSSRNSDNSVSASSPSEKGLHSEGETDHPEPISSLASANSSTFDASDSNVLTIPPSTCTASDVSSPGKTETMMSTQMDNLSVIKSDNGEIVHEVAEAHPDELKEANNEIIHESPQPLDSEQFKTIVTNTLAADPHLDVDSGNVQPSKSVEECDPSVNSKEIISTSDLSDSGTEEEHFAKSNETDGCDIKPESCIEPSTSESHRENDTCEPAAIENDGDDTTVPSNNNALSTHTVSLEATEEPNDDMKNISIDGNATDNMKIRSLSDKDKDSSEPGANTTSVEDSTINNPLPESSDGNLSMETSHHVPLALEHSTSNNSSNEIAAELSVTSNTTLEGVDSVVTVDAYEKTQISDETEMKRSKSTAMVDQSLESMKDGSVDNACDSDNTMEDDNSNENTIRANTVPVNSDNDTVENVALPSVNADTDSISDSGVSSTTSDAGGLQNALLPGGDDLPSTVSNGDMDTSVVPSSEVSTPSITPEADLVDTSPVDAIEDDSHTDLPMADASTGLSLEQTEMPDSTPDSELEESTPLAIHTPTNGGNQNELISSPGISDDSSSVVALSNDGSITPLESRHVSLTPQSDVSYVNDGSMGDGTPSSDDSFPSSDMLESDASVVHDMRQMVDVSEISSDHSIEDSVNIGDEHENYTTHTPDLSAMSDDTGSPVDSDHIPIDSSDEHSTLEDTALKDEQVSLNAEPLKTIKSATRSDTNGTTSSDASSAVVHDDSVNGDGSSQTYTSYIMSLF